MNFMQYDDGCGRYAIAAKADELKKRYNLATVPKQVPKSYDVKPGQAMPVIAATEEGEPTYELMKWGLVPSWWDKGKKVPFSTFNARDDRLFTSNVWRSIYRRRALIPATGYFEWKKTAEPKAPKPKFYFHPKELDIFSFAGFYDIWKDVDNNEWKTYTLITTEPNKEARAVHDRMPVILSREDESSWLDPARTKREDIEPFLHPLADNELEVIEVSSDAKAYEFDDAGRIAALNSR